MVETTRLFLFRHGEVDAAWRGRIYGDLDVPLSEKGEQESREAAARLEGVRLDAVVSSGLARAEFLANLLREDRGLGRRDEERLREIDRGEWRGLRPTELDDEEGNAWERWHSAPVDTSPPGGESLGDLAKRVREACRELVQEYPGGHVAIAAHSWVVRSLASEAAGIPLERVPRMVLPTGSLVVVDASPQGLRPTLSGFGLDRVPLSKRGWFRGPKAN